MADNSLPYFPSSIRSPDMNGGVVVSTYKPVLRTETEGNLVAVRPRAALSRKRITLKWTAMPASDKRVLEGFFVANQGRVFLFTNPADNAVYKVTFSDDQLQFSSLKYDGSIGEMRYGCTVNLEECGESVINSNTEPYVVSMEVTILEGAESTTISFDYMGKGSVTYGDGTDDPLSSGTGSWSTAYHTYDEPGVYTLSIEARNITRLQFNSVQYTAIKQFHIPDTFTNVSHMFSETAITEIPDFFMHPESVTTANGEFMGCVYLERIGTAFRNVDATTDARSQFSGCTNLADIGNFTNGANTIRCSSQFLYCTSLVSAGALANSPMAIGLDYQFRNCTSLLSADFNALFPVFKQSVDVYGMFQNCGLLSGTVPLSRTIESDKPTNYTYCFDGCVSLNNYYQIPGDWGGPQTGPVYVAFKYGGTQTAVTTGTATLTIGDWTQTVNIDSVGEANFTDAPQGYQLQYGISADIDGYTPIVDTVSYGQTVYVWPAVESETVKFKVAVPSSKVYQLALQANGAADQTAIDWGDGNTQSIGSSTFQTYSHTYSAAGNYTVSVTNAKRLKLDGQTTTASTTTTYGAMVTGIVSADLDGLANCEGMFENLLNLTSLPPTMSIPQNVGNMSYMFYYTPLLEIPATLWPSGYRPSAISLAHAFEQSTVRSNMTGTIPADRLWNDTSVIWTATDCFKNCDSLDNYDEIPSVWGGGN